MFQKFLGPNCWVLAFFGMTVIGGAFFYQATSGVLSVAETVSKPGSTIVTRLASRPFEKALPLVSANDSPELLLQAARDRVARSPKLAVEWAQSQSNPELRRKLLVAVLSAWAEIDPSAAVDWAWSQSGSLRESLLAAAFSGAVQQPESLLPLMQKLIARQGNESSGYGALAIRALGTSGNFQLALPLLKVAPMDSRKDWANVLFHDWTEARPREAMQAAEAIDDLQVRDSALESVIQGWGNRDPSALAAYAISTPPGEDRDRALFKAMDNWSLQDPAGLSKWLSTLPPGTEFDEGVALMISKTDGVNRTPALAMQWVEVIRDLSLKQDCLMKVVTEWKRSDPAAAAHYVANASWLEQPQRAAILKSLTTDSP